jgi:radical SAM superfamily enzyme YgiQ (UPF0313 family)
MRIVFVYNGAECLGIECLSSFLKSKKHEVHLVFDPAVFSGDVFINSKALARLFNKDRTVAESVIQSAPDVVAFSSYTGNFRWCLGIARALRERISAPIVFGGVHPTALPERVLAHDCIDYAVVGEGEFAFLDILENIEQGREKRALSSTPNVCFAHDGQVFVNKPRPYIRDLDSLPFPDKDLFFDKEPALKKLPYLIMTARGCPFQCAFCSNSMYHDLYNGEKQHVRRRSPDNVIEELVQAKRRYGIREVNFLDDVFTVLVPWMEEFLEQYKSRINLPFYCHAYPSTVNAKVAALLKKGGCHSVGMGVQSGSERMRKDIYRRPGTNERLIESVAHLKEVGIPVQLDIILGGPTETEAEAKESLELCKKLEPDRVLSFWLTYYPGAPIIEAALKENAVTEELIEANKDGDIGYTHGAGSVSGARARMFSKYEFLCTLTAICRSKWLFALLANTIGRLPLKSLMSTVVLTLTGLRHQRRYILGKFRYAYASVCSHRPTRRPSPRHPTRQQPAESLLRRR